MARLKSARLTDADFGNRIDNELGNLEVDLATIFGLPLDIDMNDSLFGCNPNGLLSIRLKNSGAPGLDAISRNGVYLQYQFGAGIRTVVTDNQIQAPSNAAGMHTISTSAPVGVPADWDVWDRI